MTNSTSGTNSLSSSLTAGGATADKVEAFLGKGSKVVGTLTFSGPVELDGYVEGEIISQDRLTIGESAVINARITGAEVLVKGTVNGDISASKRLSLRRPARIVGNISTTSLSIEEGVIFEGKSTMASGATASGMGAGAAKSLDSKSSAVRPLGSEKLGATA